MARVTYGSLVTKINGSVGGTTFQDNKYGFTAKNKANMIRPWSSYQRMMQGYMSRAVKSWVQLSSADRTNWNNYASSHPVYAKHNLSSQLSGYALFVKWTFNQFLRHQDVIESPNIILPASPGITLSIEWSGIEWLLRLFIPGGAGEWGLSFYMSYPLGIAQNFTGTKPRFIHSLLDISDYFAFEGLYTARTGIAIATGQRIAVTYIRFQNDGGFVFSPVTEILTVPSK